MKSYDSPPHAGIPNQTFYLTSAQVSVFDWPDSGYSINLIKFIIL